MMGLILRDFDAEQERLCAQQDTPDESEAPAEPVFSFTEAELSKLLADARAEGALSGQREGEDAGRKAAEAAATAKTEQALATIEAQFAEFVQQDALRRAELERDLVDMVLEVCERLVPDFLRAYSAELAHARIAQAVHMGMDHAKLEIRLAPETQQALADPLGQLDPAQDYLTVLPDTTLTPGQTVISWQNGFMEYNLEHICKELLSALQDASKQMHNISPKV